MKKISHLFALLMCCAIVISLSYCSSDDGGDIVEDDITLDDVNALVEAIDIPGAATVDGDPPAPTSDPDSPVIEDANDVITSQGGNPRLEINQASGGAAGIYLQIQGSDSYYDIPASAFTGGRISQTDSPPAVDLALPDEIEPGIFCVDYCIYDAEARVSNIVTVCIDVKEFGGANSDFLLGIWQVLTVTEQDPGEAPQTIQIGLDAFVDEFNVNLGCADGTFRDFQAEEEEFFEFIQINFAEGGNMRFESRFTDTIVDFANSSCQSGLQYTEESGMDNADGAWSYDDTEKRLIMVIDFEDDGEDVINLVITIDGNTMTGVQTFDDGATDTIVFQKQP